MKIPKHLHGNSARIDPNKSIIPAFLSSASEYGNGVTPRYRGVGIYGSNAYSRSYGRIGDIGDPDFEIAEQGMEEVNSNPL